MDSERKNESRIFLIAAAVAVVLSISVMVFVAVQGMHETKPHRHPAPSARSAQQADHEKHGPEWLFRATDWVVLVASKGLT